MRNKQISLLILLCTLLSPSTLFAQIKEYTTVIDRSDYTHFYLQNNQLDTTFLSRINNERVLTAQRYFRIVPGKGGMKDENGIREREKQYLISTDSNFWEKDTIATILKGGRVIISGDAKFIRQRCSTGWEYLNTREEKVCELQLLWNRMDWFYTIQYYSEEEGIDTLHNIISLSLIQLALAESKCVNSKEEDDDIWDYLYLSLWLLDMFD